MIYVQFYQRSALNPDDIIEACGDRSVVILDGRCSKQWMGETSAAECKRRGYVAWRIFKGETFTRSAPVSQLWHVQPTEPVRNPMWLSAHN
jgi:hypothetical protein